MIYYKYNFIVYHAYNWQIGGNKMDGHIIKTCCFTGHRKIPTEQTEQIIERIEKVLIGLIHEKFNCFMTGGALGFDTLAAQTVLRLKAQFPDIRLILALPCETQAKGWKHEDQHLYEEIKLAANQVIYTSSAYYRGCMHKRNRYLVDHSSICICYLKKPTGGTAYTVNYAKKHGRFVINIAEESDNP